MINSGNTPVGYFQMFKHLLEDNFKISSIIYDNDCTNTECEEEFFYEYFYKSGCGDVEGRD